MFDMVEEIQFHKTFSLPGEADVGSIQSKFKDYKRSPFQDYVSGKR